ncbi:RrF2 family transcriptional regulator [Gallibacterium sp. AGMB14963]|uniref:RrF2 family transcriptional regulator n=1 Tax=Gallibacterium faecale TaxID=3019086 RepID=UPI0022F17632|nr:Rrf2 family transcriptional regulator [Gallibacterium sp. AGMB14963]MDA3978367.1 Rrf2 family transcriptional regulator [Gallibacterium sp. AGMB14963]
MKLSTFTDYNLRVLLYLAAHQEKLSTIQEIATVYNISENHLMKVIHHLAKNNFIQSIRGKGGGIRLHRHPSELNLGDIIRLAEEKSVIVECFGERNQCCISANCQLPPILVNAFAAFYRSLSQYTLQDILLDQQIFTSLPTNISK